VLALISLAVAEGEGLVLSSSESFSLNALAWLLVIVDSVVLAILFALLPLWFFFFLDSRATIGDFFVSWKRAFLMALYALPVWLLLFVVLEWILGLFEMVTVVESWWSLILVTFVSICVQIMVACLLSVFYTKRLHEQFEFYFPGPQRQE
jgi:glucan phosphoethanolaminetransferase (alkaline phosphatase superfamily)